MTAGLVLVCLLAAAAPQATAAAVEGGVIIPGQSIGTWRLGTQIGAVYQAAGQPDGTRTSGSISYMYYGRQSITVAIKESLVAMVLTTDERFKTDKGIGAGQPVTAATAAYGLPPRGREGRAYWYDAIGLVVVTGGDSIVRLGVYDPKHLVRAILEDERPAHDVFLRATLAKAAAAAKAAGGPSGQVLRVTVTLQNAAAADKTMNPNFFVLTDREGQTYRYDRSTFRLDNACGSRLVVNTGGSRSCALAFMVPAGRNLRSIVYSDGASLDEFYF